MPLLPTHGILFKPGSDNAIILEALHAYRDREAAAGRATNASRIADCITRFCQREYDAGRDLAL